VRPPSFTPRRLAAQRSCRRLPQDKPLRRARTARANERYQRRAAEQRDQLAAFHSITSSARNRNDSGIVSPSALAVFIDGQLEFDRLHKQATVLVVGHVGSETTTKISIAGVAVANQPVSCRSSLARQRPEILRRAAMFC
jgi:hypothetical protein